MLAAVLYGVLSGGDSTKKGTAGPSGNPTSPSSSPSPTQSPKPTAQGMESFIRDYVRTVGEDPSVSWKMLTPKFQRESGGFDTYRKFWDSATNGRVLHISANPRSLVVSYQVHFDNFKNGPGPTVLQLVFDQGRYLIDGESTKGFVPAG